MKALLLLLFLTVTVSAGRKKNCGLTCYRWEKCLGQIDGSNRPGQLGDTGIIILNTCSPIENGCDCAKLLTEDKTTTTSTTTSTTSRSVQSSSFSRPGLTRSRSHLRLPRKHNPEDLKEQSEVKPATSYRNRLASRYTVSSSSSSSSSHISARHAGSETTTTKTTTEVPSSSFRRSFYTRTGRGISRFRLAERL